MVSIVQQSWQRWSFGFQSDPIRRDPRVTALFNTLSEHIDIFHADYYDVVDLAELNER
jgi:hypothetical protein